MHLDIYKKSSQFPIHQFLKILIAACECALKYCIYWFGRRQSYIAHKFYQFFAVKFLNAPITQIVNNYLG